MAPSIRQCLHVVGISPFQGPDAEGAGPLLLCNGVQYILLSSLNAGGRPLSIVLEPAGVDGSAPGESGGAVRP